MHIIHDARSTQQKLDSPKLHCLSVGISSVVSTDYGICFHLYSHPSSMLVTYRKEVKGN
jgi:hypothetical protein